jgi:hypothetical protein
MHRRNEDILELETEPVENKLAQYKQKWRNNVSIKFDLQQTNKEMPTHKRT